MRALICQINTTPGDFEGNCKQIIEGIRYGNKEKVDLIVFPELSIPGYLCKDMMFRQGFVEKNKYYLQKIVQECTARETHVVVGYIEKNYEGWGKPFRNMAAIIKNKAVVTTYQKHLLPFYDVFDEGRYFHPGNSLVVIEIDNKKFGICICEDLWNDKDSDDYNYNSNPLEAYQKLGVYNIISINSSPYIVGKVLKRADILNKASAYGTVIYCNQIGGQDELVFDGNSLVAQSGHIRICSKQDLYTIYDSVESPSYSQFWGEENTSLVYKMLSMGLKDYVLKSGFKQVVVGSSGGIDSALVISLACDALGPENVHAIRMPSNISSEHSKNDAKELHDNLGCHDYLVGFDHEMWTKHILTSLKSQKDQELYKYNPNPVANENIQARLRGMILMYFSNAYDALLLTTGNKTELALGFCTIYGDMAGGFAPINDLYKLEVYEMARYYNENINCAIPKNIIEKKPSAELAPGQEDEKILLPYPILDSIVKSYVEHFIADFDKFKRKNNKAKEWAESTRNAEIEYYRILKMIDRNEFKRRQTAPGIKLTKVAFGIGRRLPIVKGPI